ncbi:DUF6152 family protein [Uliginosibacterium sp. H1]|uniref:DUF6152 family protein n=1 Tax=Uliginosibacterium sp. H1 TaxID=3114757 RepID=UPI002E1879E8|nr:DUF6152 family protein [Uliginosibacterium sp. H1]
MNRRSFVLALPATCAVLTLPRAFAHHGWSSFDDNRPIYLEGTVKKASWQNPHVELILETPADLKLPADLAKRSVPAQSTSLDAAGILGKTTVPRRKDRTWEIELAPLTRMNQWKVPEIKAGEQIALVGYTFKDEQGEAILRAEYLFRGNSVTPLRSGPV